MKVILPPTAILIALAFLGAAPLSAQEIKIAVVDMQEALNQYYKTDIQVKQINDLADEKRKNLDERQAAYQQMTNQMVELDTVYKDTALSEAKRKEALTKLQSLFQEREAKAKEIADAQRKAAAEIQTARQEMEATLVGEIKKTVDTIVQSQGLDLVFDKSFLPKANKAILYTSANVKDLTAEVVSTLNAGAPAGAETTSN
jgi:outer membrane protein